MDLDPRLLRYFAAVAEELSFSRAAERLHISQPPLSYAIKQLEEALEVRLLDRNSRNVALTAAGAALYKEAMFLLQRNAEVKQLVRSVDAGAQGQIRIGFVGSMLYRGLAELLKRFDARYPKVEHVLLELNSAEQIQLVERSGLDIGFIHANPVPEGMACLTLVEEPFSVCLPERHPLARGDSIDLATLADEHFIFFSRLFSPSYYETLLSMCLRAGFFPSVKKEARHWLSVATLVSQELGVSIVPRCLARSRLAGLRFLDFEHNRKSVSSLIWMPAHESRIKDKHIELIREHWGGGQTPAR